MKKVSSLAIILFTSLSIYCQTPELMSYQAVVRDADSELLTDQAVGMKISILEDSSTGSPVYIETHNPSTNSNGLLSLQVGAGTVVSGDITTIDWANHDYFIKTETDPTGGENYTIAGTSQILSVPYALLSKNVINDMVDDADNDPSNEYNTEIGLNGSILSIVDGGGIQNTDLSSLQGQGETGPQGEPGPQGPIGLTGDTGSQGPIGLTGATGDQGPQGDQGEQGPQGEQGEQGIQGDTGPAGATGPPGSQGTPGNDGQDGPQGPQGEQGEEGQEGPSGQDGAVGSTGEQGPQGEQGEQGEQGPQGEQGEQGEQGIQGDTGPAGATGPPGSQGTPGNDGQDGQDGEDGQDGVDGQDGEDGLTAYEIWINAGNTGTEADFLASLVGPEGPLVSGTNGQTLYNNGDQWISTSNLYNDGSSVSIGTDDIDPSAVLQIESTTQGVLFPKMTAEQRDLIATPQVGLLIFQTDNSPGFYFYNGTAWVALNVSNGTNSGGSDSKTLIYTTDGF
jgi:hypothetical protein